MPRIRLTDATVRSIKPTARQVPYWDETLPGFGLRVAPGGAQTWIVQYRRGGQTRRLTLGRYPLVSLADARAQAKEALAAVVQGADPAAERRAEHDAVTFKELVNEYMERHAKTRKRSWKKDEYMFQRYVPTAWFTRKAQDISRREVRDLLDDLARRIPVQANRVLALLKKLYTFGVARELVPSSPCLAIERPTKEKARERVLSTDELRQVWKALDTEDAQTAALFKLYLLTGQRGGELRTMRWADLDLEAAAWTIPAERAKNGHAHTVPLSPQAVTLLRALQEGSQSPWAFPSEDSRQGHRQSVQRATARIVERSKVSFEPHDLRRTCASQLTALGVPRLTVSKLLNHAEQGVTAVYDRHSYLPEMRRALVRWALRLEKIVHGETAEKVRQLRA